MEKRAWKARALADREASLALHHVRGTLRPNAARLFTDFALSKEGQEMVRAGLREPARADVESPSLVSSKSYKRVVIGPESYRDYKENVRLYQEIFRTR
jgi:ABC-type Fe3+ transport system substrate-binding protein